MSIAFLNDQFVPLAEARISPLDRGFLFADSIYEVIPVYAGKAFRLHEHLERLDFSLAEINIPNPYTQQQWQDLIEQLISKNGAETDQKIYLQVSRGSYETRAHVYDAEIKPTVFACSFKFTRSSATDNTGATLITKPDLRWHRCDIKSTNLLANILAAHEGKQDGADEVLLINSAGEVTEGSSSNVFIVKDDVIITPPKAANILGGITRDFILELLYNADFDIEERVLLQSELADATEIWISSSTREIMPVVTLDGHKVGSGIPGPIWQQAIKLYRAAL